MDDLVDCPACGGIGEIYPPVPIGFGLQPEGELCRWCRGEGCVSAVWARQYRGKRRS